MESGAPGETRTPDLLVRSQPLYPPELRARPFNNFETEFYHGWFKPHSWGLATSIVLDTTKTERTYIFAVRPPNHPFTERELAIQNDLAPHLAMTTRIERRLMALKNTINRLRNGAVQTDTLTGFNLSPTESRIALAIAPRQSPKEYAHRAGVTIDTVRWHVKHSLETWC